MKYQNLTPIDLRRHPALNEQWVQDRIAESPGILGLGDVILKDRERKQPRAGRLDLLLQDAESTRRYEVEIQLGKTDESHIIRTLEYWDIERQRYPQYDHTAVIVAEEITGRFLNVISLFNGTIPIVAIQMRAVQLDENTASLLFTTVLDVIQRGLVDEDEETQEVTDRAYWENRGSKATVAMVDDLLNSIQGIDPTLDLKYNKFYVGLARKGLANNFIVFRPQKNALRVAARIPKNDATTEALENAGVDVTDYDSKSGRYRIRLKKGEQKQYAEVLTQLFQDAYQAANGSSD